MAGGINNTSISPHIPELKGDIVSILTKQIKSPCREYDILLYILGDKRTESSTLVKYLRQLRNCVSILEKEHEKLVGALLQIGWTDRDQQFIQDYQSCLLNLISAHPYYLRACLRMLIKHFIPDQKGSASDDCYPSTAIQEKNDAMFLQVHRLLRPLAQLVPATKTVLIHFLTDFFPYITKDTYTHQAYTRNLLQLVHYLPELRVQVLDLIVDRMVRLDVRAPREEIQNSSSDEEEKDVDIFSVDKEGDKDETTGCFEGETRHPLKPPEADKLDVMMDLMITFINQITHPQGVMDWEMTKKLYCELLSSFDKFIFTTHHCCHPQFLLFYICSFKQPLWDGYLDYLWKKVTTPMTQAVFRQAAASYIGSFLSRAKYIGLSTVKSMLEVMVQWIHSYLKETDKDSLHADLLHHASFYAVCQAVFYSFSFCTQHLLQSQQGYKWAELLNLQGIVTSKLNPLRVCLPLVSQTFASTTRMHQLAFCDTIIERNQRYSFGRTDPMLDGFFPFDPYLLKRSRKWIKPLYKEYEQTITLKEHESNEDVDDFLPAEEEESSIELMLGSSLSGLNCI